MRNFHVSSNLSSHCDSLQGYQIHLMLTQQNSHLKFNKHPCCMASPVLRAAILIMAKMDKNPCSLGDGRLAKSRRNHKIEIHGI